jgi:hypothetical protein
MLEVIEHLAHCMDALKPFIHHSSSLEEQILLSNTTDHDRSACALRLEIERLLYIDPTTAAVHEFRSFIGGEGEWIEVLENLCTYVRTGREDPK